MNDDAPNFSRSTERRRVAVVVVAAVSFTLTGTPVWVGVSDLLRDVTGIPPRLLADAATVAGVSCGVVAATLTAFAVRRVHRSLWPESPDEG